MDPMVIAMVGLLCEVPHVSRRFETCIMMEIVVDSPCEWLVPKAEMLPKAFCANGIRYIIFHQPSGFPEIG